MKKETLLRALSDVGDDLLDMAQTKKFASPWKKWLTTAAVIALVLCLGAVTLPYFPMGCGSSQAPMEGLPETEEAEEMAPAEEESAPAENSQDQAAGEAPGEDCIWFAGRRYLLMEENPEPPADLGEVLGFVEDWEGTRDVGGCELFSALESDNLYVKTKDGYIRAAFQNG